MEKRSVRGDYVVRTISSWLTLRLSSASRIHASVTSAGLISVGEAHTPETLRRSPDMEHVG